VRMLGIKPGTQYGYSIYELQVFAPGDTTDLAQGKPTTASSYTPAYPPADATDGSSSTRWAVAVADRSVAGSWLQVDLGAATDIDHVTISWEVAYGAAYAVQTSLDGSTWTDAITVPTTHLVDGGWVNVDGKAGFVVRGGSNPLTVTSDILTLSDGPAAGAAGMVVEGYPAQSPAQTAALAARAVPVLADGSASSASSGSSVGGALAASTVEDHLSLFNLSGAGLGSETAPVRLEVPAQGGSRGGSSNGSTILLYRGRQTTTDSGSVYEVVLAAASARVEGPRFELSGSVPAGVVAEVTDSLHVTLTAPGTGGCRFEIAPHASGAVGEGRVVDLRAGETRQLAFTGAAVTPTPDLALGRTTYPTAPLPEGMSDPGYAVDGDPHTSWRPGTHGARLVVDLGVASTLGALSTSWTRGAPVGFAVSVSTDGLAYTQTASGSSVRTDRPVSLNNVTARYVALAVPDWSAAGATLVSLSITA
jgi:F5/8 type C domain